MTGVSHGNALCFHDYLVLMGAIRFQSADRVQSATFPQLDLESFGIESRKQDSGYVPKLPRGGGGTLLLTFSMSYINSEKCRTPLIWNNIHVPNF